MKFVVVALMLIISCVGFEATYEQVQDSHIRQSATTLMGQSSSGNGIVCNSGVTSFSSFGAVTSQEITVLTGLPGSYRYTNVVISETTQFSGGSGTGLTVSMGRPGNDLELTGGTTIPLMLSGGDINYQSYVPPPPQLTSTYSLVLSFVGDGTHLLNTYTAGSVTWEVCHYVGATR